MIEVQADKSSGVIRITFSAKVSALEAAGWMTKTVALVDEMPHGFQLLADLSALDSLDVACAPFIAQVMDHCNERGIKKVVRVIPDPRKDIGLSIMSIFHYDRHVRILTFHNLRNAEEAVRQSAPSGEAGSSRE